MISSDNLDKIKSIISNETFLERYGSTWLIDSFYLFLITPSAYIGLILNLLNIFIFTKIAHQQTTVLYKYLIVYCINNEVLCLLACISFYVYTSRYLGVKLDYFARICYCVMINWICVTLYFFGNLLDIIISIERLSIFVKNLKWFTQLNFLIVCLVTFLFSIFVNIPTYLRIYVKTDNETYNDLFKILDDVNNITFSTCGQGLLYKNYILIGLNIFIRDIVSLMSEIVLSIFILKKFREYKSNRSILINNKDQSTNEQKNKDNHVKLTSMTIYLSLLAIISHTTLCLVFAFFYVENIIFQSYLALISYSAIFLKHAYSFFIFYYFNNNFKKSFLDLIKRKNVKVNVLKT